MRFCPMIQNGWLESKHFEKGKKNLFFFFLGKLQKQSLKYVSNCNYTLKFSLVKIVKIEPSNLKKFMLSMIVKF